MLNVKAARGGVPGRSVRLGAAGGPERRLLVARRALLAAGLARGVRADGDQRRCHGRVLLARHEAHARLGRGARSGERLHKAGLYRQFQASTETWGHRVGKIVTTMATVLYNFTRWNFEAGAEHGLFRITIDDAAAAEWVAVRTANIS
jgi:hypothetical protein